MWNDQYTFSSGVQKHKSDVTPTSSTSSEPSPADINLRLWLKWLGLFRKAVGPKHWKDIKHLFKDTTFIKMEDTGGQPEFMDMLPALTIGPALYLLFCKLIDDLKSRYTVSYLSPSGESTTPVESTYTVEEVLLTALASISCFKSYSSMLLKSAVRRPPLSSNIEELLTSCKESLAYIIGTHKDKVSESR